MKWKAFYFDTKKSILPDTPNSQELSLGVFHMMNENVIIRSRVFKGLTKSGPEIGLDFGIINWFK